MKLLKKSDRKFRDSELIWALSKAGDFKLRPLFRKYLERFLRDVRYANHGLSQVLIALEKTGEWKALPEPNQTELIESIDQADKNIIMAWRYLRKHGIIVPL